MANLTETSTYEPGVYQIELTDPIQGGPDGISNLQARQLANRTRYLKDRFELGHTVDGAHEILNLKADLANALTNQQISSTAGLSESKLNLIFRGTERPGGQGIYSTTREIVDDLLWLSTMNSLGDLMLSKTTLEIARDLCYQFYPSSGTLYAGAVALDGHTAVLDGEVGGGIFTIDTADESMANKVLLEGIIQFLIDGYTIPIQAPVTIDLPEADDFYHVAPRVDLMYVRIHHENVTQTNQFYPSANRAGTALDWTGMTEVQRKEAAVLIENNLYTGADYNVYQIQYEILVAAEASELTDIGYTQTVDDSYLYESGEYKAIKLCDITRRNQGAFHSVFNTEGTAAFYGDSIVLEENEVTHSAPSYDIAAVSTVNNTFSIAGDYAADFLEGSRFNVTGAVSGENDNSRDYQVAADATFADPNTVIEVTREITADTGANGQIHKGWPASPFYDIQATTTAEQQFTLSGDRVSEFPVGYGIEVIGTSTNDGDYAVTAVELDGSGDTLITVDSAIDNTGATGKLHSLTWFHINYCFSRRSVGLDGHVSGSVESGVAAHSSDSTMDELGYAHDIIRNGDIVDGRIFLATAERATDPNLTLNAPVIESMVSSVYELDTVELTINPYVEAYTYTIRAVDSNSGVDVGTLTQDGDIITWELPEISSDKIVRFSISAEDASSNISPVTRYSVTVLNIPVEGDDAILTASSDWTTLSDATTSVDGVESTAVGATAYTDYFDQGAGEFSWAKYQAAIDRDLYEWTVDGTSTVSSLVLVGDHELTDTQVYAVKFAGLTEVLITDLGVTGVSWDAGAGANTLTLGSALAEIPEMVWTWDIVVEVAVGDDGEALVHETELTLDAGETTTTQVVGAHATTGLWVNGGYNNTVKITVDGTVKTVTVLGVAEVAGVYTLQIPEQTHAPTTMHKPTCFVALADPSAVDYDSVDDTVHAVYPQVVTQDGEARRIRIYAAFGTSGVVLKPVMLDLWRNLS